MKNIKMKTSFTIQIPKKISTNSIYAGVHWTKRKAFKDLMILSTCAQFKDATKHDCRVNLSFIFTFKNRPLDSSNCSYMAKVIEDCMVHYGILKDDTIKSVKSVTYESQKGDRDECTVAINHVSDNHAIRAR